MSARITPLSPIIGSEIRGIDLSQPVDDALFGEIERSFAPLIESFHACRFVAQSNAWASVLDYLAAGFIQAGHEGLGSEQAWDLWNGTVAASPFPTKRRPRRFQFGDSEVAVRAGCCLWYVTDRAKAAPQRYCTTCYLLPDQQRLAALTRA